MQGIFKNQKTLSQRVATLERIAVEHEARIASLEEDKEAEAIEDQRELEVLNYRKKVLTQMHEEIKAGKF